MADKADRILSMLTRFENGDFIRIKEEANRFNCSTRTIYRDIQTIRNFYAELHHSDDFVIYDHKRGVYFLNHNPKAGLTAMESFALAKLALESRSLVRSEMMPMLNKLMRSCLRLEDYQKVKQLLESEIKHYVELQHGKELLKETWDIATAVYEKRLLEITYKKLSSNIPVKRIVKPVGIMFSEFYYYLTAYIKRADDLEELPTSTIPTIYRIDRILKYKILDDHFQVPYERQFEEGEFRKRIQFMTGGELRYILFKYKGRSVEAILDRLPTARVLEKDEDGVIIDTEVYGNGINRWIRAQGDEIEILENREFNERS